MKFVVGGRDVSLRNTDNLEKISVVQSSDCFF